METNFIVITNYAFVVSTNPVPVIFSGFDFDTTMNLYISGFANAAPLAILVTVCALIYKSLHKPIFPSSSE